MKKLATISLIALILLQSFSKVWIVVSFKLNQDYIAKALCINRKKPEVLCNGKCVLNDRLKADEGQDKKQLPLKLKEQKEVLYCFEQLKQASVAFGQPGTRVNSPVHYQMPCIRTVVQDIFHPPDNPAA